MMSDQNIFIVNLMLVLAPYCLLAIKKTNIGTKMVMVSLGGVFLLVILSTAYALTNNQILLSILFSYNIFLWGSVLINLFIGVFWWILRVIRKK